MKKGNGKGILISISALAIVGGLYYFLIYKKGKVNVDVKGKRADFIVDGFVYTIGTKAQAYPKKVGEFGGMLVESYKDDKDFWLAKNVKAQEILLKKSDVTIV
jgi:hypothetical protein